MLHGNNAISNTAKVDEPTLRTTCGFNPEIRQPPLKPLNKAISSAECTEITFDKSIKLKLAAK